ncbi:MAG: hypothetical protein ABF290_17125 [Thiogranum sp.]
MRLPRSYWAVERVLASLGPCHRIVGYAEAGLLNGRIPPRAGLGERAALLGFSRWKYRRHLKLLRQRLRWELDRRSGWRAVG